MANDLIPPPSPAVRPQPAGTPRLVEMPPEPALDHPPPAAPKLPPSKHRNRFGFLLGALGGMLIAAILALVAVLAGGGTRAADEGLAANWSMWQPQDTTLEGGAAEIAEKVGAEYTHPDGKQLVLVTGTSVPIPVALRPGAGPIQVFRDSGVLYQLNGLGPNNSIKGGTPSPNRLKVIQREALELALYTFRYLPDAELVVLLLPPPPPKDGTGAAATGGLLANATADAPKTALFYRPGDLKGQMVVPLGHTMPALAPTPSNLTAAESSTIDLLTRGNVFEWSVQESAGLLVLDRPVP